MLKFPTNCKHCHYYHGKNDIVCANHPFGPPKEYSCSDYRASNNHSVLVSINQYFFRFLFEEVGEDWLCFLSKIELDSGRKRVEMLSSEMISILQWSDRLLLDKVLLPNEFITIYGVKLSNDLTGFIYKCCKRYRHQYRHQSTLSFRWIALDGEGNLIGTYEQQSLAIFALLGWRKAFLCYCQNSLKNTYQEAIAFTLNKGILLLPVIGFWLINFIDFIYHTAIVSSSIGHLLIFGLSAIAFLIWFINL